VVLLSIVATATIPLWAKGAKGMSDFRIAEMYLLLPFVAAGFSLVAINLVRTRESLFTTFQVSSTGITLENSRYGVLSLDWNEVTQATYCRLAKMIILESPRLWQPLVIMNFGGNSVAPEFAAARTLIRSAMRDRWIERLFKLPGI
jgi:hypothetical protein